MGYVKVFGSKTLYQGQSFSKSLTKKDGSIWESNEVGDFEMFNSDGTVVSSGSLVKSGDNLSLTFTIPDDDTASLVGAHTINADLTDTVDDAIRIPLAEYDMTYKEKKAV